MLERGWNVYSSTFVHFNYGFTHCLHIMDIYLNITIISGILGKTYIFPYNGIIHSKKGRNLKYPKIIQINGSSHIFGDVYFFIDIRTPCPDCHSGSILQFSGFLYSGNHRPSFGLLRSLSWCLLLLRWLYDVWKTKVFRKGSASSSLQLWPQVPVWNGSSMKIKRNNSSRMAFQPIFFF